MGDKLICITKIIEKAMKIINKVFGRDFQLSKAQPEQQDLVEVVIDELKDLVF